MDTKKSENPKLGKEMIKISIKEIEQIIFKASSNIMRKMGEEVFKNGLVTNVKGRKIEEIYHIYGEVSGDKNYDELKTHIKINLKYKKLDDVRCSCENFREISKDKRLFMCEHLIATAYRFLSLLENKKCKEKKLQEKLLKQENTPKKQKEKTHVGMDIKITHKSCKGISSYELEFRLGFAQKYLIDDLVGFILNLDKEQSICFNNQFIYNPEEYVISPKDIKVVNFIREYVNKSNGIFSMGRVLTIDANDLRRFLECIEKSKIRFKYNGIEYNTTVFNTDLPLTFTLKEEKEYFKLTTYNKLPISLTENKDVYFFNDNLYLPSSNQIEKYLPLYYRFREKNEILYDKTIGNYNKIISLLNSISTDITLTEEIKRFAASLLKFEFFIYKEKEDIYCNVYTMYNNEKINILEKINKKTQVIRNSRQEERVLMKLEYYKFIKRKDTLIFIGGDEDLFNILNSKKRGIQSLGTLILGQGLEDIKLYNTSSINIDFYEGNDRFKFSYNIGDVDTRELGDIFRSYKSNSRFYKTKDNGFIDFEDEGIRNFFNLIEILDINKDIDKGSSYIEENKAIYIAESLKNRDYKFGEGIELIKNIENKITTINSKDVTVPKSLRAKLREYQIIGFKWFNSLSELGFGGILADEMGLGKTVQTIAFLVGQKGKKSLIIAPTSLIYNWKSEIERFAPELRVGIAHGNIENQEIVINNLEEYDLLLTTYGTLRNNIDKYSNIQFDYCIIDEAQNIKNFEAQVTLAVKEIKANARYALTGTPIENSLTELWSIFDFIMPGYLYSKETFEEKFIYNEDCDLENLKLIIKPFILRRTKKEVIEDLPDKIEKKILVEMTSAQKTIYKNYIKEVKEKIKDSSQGKIEIFSYLTKLRQICLDPSLVFNEYKGGSGKLKLAMALIEENIASQGKTLLFSQFTSALKKIAESLKDNEISYVYLDGSTPSKERIKLVNEFNSSNKPRVFLISLKAGGTGLNLTSANLVIHFDPWWNPAVEDQATDRAHRIGQKNVVEVIKLVSRGTIEEKIISMQEHKKELIDTIITGELTEGTMLNKLSKEELLGLFYR